MQQCVTFSLIYAIIKWLNTSFFCSFYTFSRMPEVKEIIVVCDPSYQDIFEGLKTCLQKYNIVCVCVWLTHILIFYRTQKKLIFLFSYQMLDRKSMLTWNLHCREKKDKILCSVDFRFILISHNVYSCITY